MEARHPKPKVTLRKLRRGEEDAAADREFWMAMTGEERVELLWEMVLESLGRRGDGGSDDRASGHGEPADDQPRLSRSVRLVRRP